MITLEPGTYVVAVSGGVDSVALLDMLGRQPSLKLVVAHFDHGIRDDSHLDRQLVQDIAASLRLPFVYHEGRLGAGASEAEARRFRYEFLHKVHSASGAKAIITAHHQDDLIETAVLNLLRGTHRRGLSSLQSTDAIKRPLLHVNKAELLKYAKEKGLTWREDATNQDTRYKRNYIRHHIITRLGDDDRAKLLAIIHRLAELNTAIDAQLVNHFHAQLERDKLPRHWFVQLPHATAREVLAAWLRRKGITRFDRKMLEHLVIAAKSLAPGKVIDVGISHRLQIDQKYLALTERDR